MDPPVKLKMLLSHLREYSGSNSIRTITEITLDPESKDIKNFRLLLNNITKNSVILFSGFGFLKTPEFRRQMLNYLKEYARKIAIIFADREEMTDEISSKIWTLQHF
jgi:hypothetical protein